MYDIIVKSIQLEIKRILEKSDFGYKRIFLFGCNSYTERINNFIHEEGHDITAVIDNDKEKQHKKICNIPILSPEKIDWNSNDVVLIASVHRKSMEHQLHSLSMEIEIYSLFNFEEYQIEVEKKEKFWLEENFDSEISKLYEGKEVFRRLKLTDYSIIFLPALGDIFAGGMYFQAYQKKVNSKKIKIVIASGGSYKVSQLFEMENIIIISEQELDALVKFILFTANGSENIVVCSCIHTLDTMARYKKIPFPKFWAKYFFKLGRFYSINFPSIWDKNLKNIELINKGIKKNQTIILAPYTNTLPELPYQFWEQLVDRLLEMKYSVFTNIVGKQKAIKGSKGVEIPLNQIGNYLEFSGYFISLRSGLCDVAGRSNCRQIIIYRDRKFNMNCSVIEFFDLHTENISKNAVQYVYDDKHFYKNIDAIITLLLDKK